MTELIEAVAQAIRETDSWRTWKGEQAHKESAQAALTAITDAGYRIVKGEVVAFRYSHPDHPDEFDTIFFTAGDKEAGWTCTPLYAAAPGDEK